MTDKERRRSEGPSQATRRRKARDAQLQRVMDSLTHVDDGVEEISSQVSRLTLQGPGPDMDISGREDRDSTESSYVPYGEEEGHDEPTITATPETSKFIEDLNYISKFIHDHRPLLLSGSELAFELDPPTSVGFQRRSARSIISANSGPSALRTNHLSNLPVIQYENDILNAIALLQDIPTSVHSSIAQVRGELLRHAHSELDRIESLKEAEWNRQRAGVPPLARAVTDVVNTDAYVRPPEGIWSADDTLVHSVSLIVLVMHLLEHATRRSSQLLLAGFRCVVALTLRRGGRSKMEIDELLVKKIPRDPRTLIAHSNLDPVLEVYVCCPSCYGLYPETTCPLTCNRLPGPATAPCNTALKRTRSFRGSQLTRPVRKYYHQPMKSWIGRFLCRPSIPAVLIPVDAALRDNAIMDDIWGAEALKGFLGPDGKPFWVHAAGETRLVFGLAVDGFNPYQSKTAKQKVTSTAIYMICYNLPLHLRYLPENMYLVGVIPGPGKPSLDQINPFLELLVNDLLEFWSPGVHFSRTAQHPSRHLVRAALVPLICDILAARQVAGLGSHSSTYFCSFCYLKLEDIENFDSASWPQRHSEFHRAQAYRWRDAETVDVREKIFDDSGVRWSELLRLPYWDPIRFTVVDSMHNLYLGLIKTHCRDIWGMKVDAEDGDATTNPNKSPPPRPTAAAMKAGLSVLHFGSFGDLLRCTKSVLWYLCEERDLRRASTVKNLARELDTWRRRQGYPRVASQSCPSPSVTPHCHPSGPHPAATSSAGQFLPPNANVVHSVPTNVSRLGPAAANKAPTQAPPDPKAVESANRNLLKNRNPAALARANRNVLNALCKQYGLSDEGPNKMVVALRLVAAVERRESSMGDVQDAHACETAALDSSTPAPETAIPKPRGRGGPVLGQEAFATIRQVREAMQLPSWINQVPRGFGTSEHGKLSADQWHTVCTVLLPVSLVLLWGHETGRKADMLRNFMELATAVVLAGMWRISSSHIDLFDHYLRRYLEGLKDLYKEAKIVPNHHLALHLPVFMRLFGPVQSWRAFVFERFNYILQNTNTNLTFGEMEGTFMKTNCRAANLRPLLQDPRVAVALGEFLEAYRDVSGEDERGMRLDSVLRSAGAFVVPDLREGARGSETQLDNETYAALLARLNTEANTSLFVDGTVANKLNGQRYLSRAIREHTDIIIYGIHYRTKHASARDSNIRFHPSTGNPSVSTGYIRRIFTHRRKSSEGATVVETFLAVKALAELSEADAVHDKFRTFPYAGGRLYYDRDVDGIHVIRPQDVLCHVARTPLKIPGIHEQCAHMLPLDRLLKISTATANSNSSEDGAGDV